MFERHVEFVAIPRTPLPLDALYVEFVDRVQRLSGVAPEIDVVFAWGDIEGKGKSVAAAVVDFNAKVAGALTSGRRVTVDRVTIAIDALEGSVTGVVFVRAPLDDPPLIRVQSSNALWARVVAASIRTAIAHASYETPPVPVPVSRRRRVTRAATRKVAIDVVVSLLAMWIVRSGDVVTHMAGGLVNPVPEPVLVGFFDRVASDGTFEFVKERWGCDLDEYLMDGVLRQVATDRKGCWIEFGVTNLKPEHGHPTGPFCVFVRHQCRPANVHRGTAFEEDLFEGERRHGQLIFEIPPEEPFEVSVRSSKDSRQLVFDAEGVPEARVAPVGPALPRPVVTVPPVTLPAPRYREPAAVPGRQASRGTVAAGRAANLRRVVPAALVVAPSGPRHGLVPSRVREPRPAPRLRRTVRPGRWHAAAGPA